MKTLTTQTMRKPLQTGFRFEGAACYGPLFNEYGKRRAPIVHTKRQHGARRRERIRRATPKWVDQQKIRDLITEAAELTFDTGHLYVVDHIVPLESKLVCGLHWHVNMQVMHWKENAQKGAWTWPGMPMEQLELEI